MKIEAYHFSSEKFYDGSHFGSHHESQIYMTTAIGTSRWMQHQNREKHCPRRFPSFGGTWREPFILVICTPLWAATSHTIHGWLTWPAGQLVVGAWLSGPCGRHMPTVKELALRRKKSKSNKWCLCEDCQCQQKLRKRPRCLRRSRSISSGRD